MPDMATDDILHTDFTIKRRLKTSPRHAFRFWSEPALKARWNDCHTDWTVLVDAFDFRVGGMDDKHWRMPDGQDLTYTAHYLDIVAGQRIIYAYQMTWGGRRLSGSLVTVTFDASPEGTLMTFVEQAALIGGGEKARQMRVHGTAEGFDRLAELADGGLLA